jgi:hypothetical protein
MIRIRRVKCCWNCKFGSKRVGWWKRNVKVVCLIHSQYKEPDHICKSHKLIDTDECRKNWWFVRSVPKPKENIQGEIRNE